MINEFNDKYFPGWREWENIYYSNAVAGEAGELCNVVKKSIGGGTKHDLRSPAEFDRDIKEEIADMAIYLHIFALKLGTKLDALIRLKMKELERRMNERRKVK